MCRRKGDTFRKTKLKEVKRAPCPSWTINEKLLSEIEKYAKLLKVSQSRIVENAIKHVFFDKNHMNSMINKNKLFDTPIL